MGNYDFHYKAYYDGIKGKSGGVYKPAGSSIDDYLSRASGRVQGNKGNSVNFISSVANWAIGQLIITLILFFIIFGAKYSTDEKLVGYYNLFRDSIRKDYSVTELQADVKELNLTSIITKVKDSVKWVSDKIDSNPINQ